MTPESIEAFLAHQGETSLFGNPFEPGMREGYSECNIWISDLD